MPRRGVRGFSPTDLRAYRERAKLTLEELADKAGVSVQSLSAWERNVNVPGVKPLGAVAAALRVRVANLIPVPDGDLELDHLRTRAVLTQKDVAERLGVSETVVAQLERGRKQIKADRVNELATIYDVDPSVVEQAWLRTVETRRIRLQSK